VKSPTETSPKPRVCCIMHRGFCAACTTWNGKGPHRCIRKRDVHTLWQVLWFSKRRDDWDDWGKPSAVLQRCQERFERLPAWLQLEAMHQLEKQLEALNKCPPNAAEIFANILYKLKVNPPSERLRSPGTSCALLSCQCCISGVVALPLMKTWHGLMKTGLSLWTSVCPMHQRGSLQLEDQSSEGVCPISGHILCPAECQLHQVICLRVSSCPDQPCIDPLASGSWFAISLHIICSWFYGFFA